MARRKEQASEGAPEWMTTYSDLVTLLLTFFILLFSFSTINKQKFDEVARSLSATFMKFDGGNSILSGSGNSIITVNFVNPSDEQKAQQKEKYIESAEEMVIDAHSSRLMIKKMDVAKEEIRQMKEAEGLDDKVQVV
jgi:chemotaxis protein MotB